MCIAARRYLQDTAPAEGDEARRAAESKLVDRLVVNQPDVTFQGLADMCVDVCADVCVDVYADVCVDTCNVHTRTHTSKRSGNVTS